MVDVLGPCEQKRKVAEMLVLPKVIQLTSDRAGIKIKVSSSTRALNKPTVVERDNVQLQSTGFSCSQWLQWWDHRNFLGFSTRASTAGSHGWIYEPKLRSPLGDYFLKKNSHKTKFIQQLGKSFDCKYPTV